MKTNKKGYKVCFYDKYFSEKIYDCKICEEINEIQVFFAVKIINLDTHMVDYENGNRITREAKKFELMLDAIEPPTKLFSVLIIIK